MKKSAKILIITAVLVVVTVILIVLLRRRNSRTRELRNVAGWISGGQNFPVYRMSDKYSIDGVMNYAFIKDRDYTLVKSVKIDPDSWILGQYGELTAKFYPVYQINFTDGSKTYLLSGDKYVIATDLT